MQTGDPEGRWGLVNNGRWVFLKAGETEKPTVSRNASHGWRSMAADLTRPVAKVDQHGAPRASERWGRYEISRYPKRLNY
jgi:hypothetical protein